ncbi:hypothetical protein [Caulobacter segnis]
MEFMLTILVIVTLCMLRPLYREFKSGEYRAGKTVGAVAILAGYCALAWVGSMAWSNTLPPDLAEGPLAVIAGYCGFLIFPALFIVPCFLAMILAQALTGAWWLMRGRPTA